MLIEYDGSRYKGWQRLKGEENTIQGKLENVISQMLGKEVEIIGSGRTDAGAHALGQVANFHTDSKMSEREMLTYLNHYLPQDIVVKSLREAGERFHSRFNVSEKKYTYRIWNHWIPSAFHRKYSYHIPDNLNLKAMEAATQKLIGTHDYLAFSSVKKSNKSTVRTIKEISFEKQEHLLEITFIGDGFLHNMIRIMVGTLIEIGLGNLGADEIDKIFAQGKREAAGKTVPAQGLFLSEVYYD